MSNEWEQLQMLIQESVQDEEFANLIITTLNEEAQFLLQENAFLLLEADANMWGKIKEFFVKLKERLKAVGDKFLKDSMSEFKANDAYLKKNKDKLLSLTESEIGSHTMVPYWDGTEVWKKITVPQFNPNNFQSYKDGKSVIGHVTSSVRTLSGLTAENFATSLEAAMSGGDAKEFNSTFLKKKIPDMITFCETYQAVYSRIKMDQAEIDEAVNAAIKEVENQMNQINTAKSGTVDKNSSKGINNLAIKVNQETADLLNIFNEAGGTTADEQLDRLTGESPNQIGGSANSNKPKTVTPKGNPTPEQKNLNDQTKERLKANRPQPNEDRVDKAIDKLEDINPGRTNSNNNVANKNVPNQSTMQKNNPSTSQNISNNTQKSNTNVNVKDNNDGKDKITAYKDYARFSGFILTQKMSVIVAKYKAYMDFFKKIISDSEGDTTNSSKGSKESFEKLDSSYRIDRDKVELDTKAEGKIDKNNIPLLNSEIYQATICISNQIERFNLKKDDPEVINNLIDYTHGLCKDNRKLYDKHKIGQKYQAYKSQYNSTNGNKFEKTNSQVRAMKQFNLFVRSIYSDKKLKSEKQEKAKAKEETNSEKNEE